MTSGSSSSEDAIQLNELLAAIWRGKLIVLALAFLGIAAGLAVGIALNIARPLKFEGAVEISPLGPGEFSVYSGLAQARVFSYTPNTLKDEYLTFLRDPEKLASLAQQEAIISHDGKSEKEYAQAITAFLNDISFETVNTGFDKSLTNRITVKAGSLEALVNFLQRAISDASKALSKQLVSEIKNKVQAMRDAQTSVVLGIMVKISASKQEANSQRTDLIARLTEDSAIAKSLGIKKPIIAQSLPGSSGLEESPTVSVVPPKNYLQGYESLDEQIRLLEKRADSDAYARDLRQLERELYLVKNDPQADRVLAILAETPLAHPDTSVLVRTTVRMPNVKQTHGRFSMFGGVGLLLGLIFGTSAAAMRGIRYSRRVDPTQTT